MRVLVLGGTRFLSRETARQAVARGHEVVCAARGEGGEPPPGAQFVRIDRDDEHALSTPTVSSPWSVLSGHFDAVIDVGRLPSHIGRALRDLGERTTHWTFVSTVSVYADHATPGQSPKTGPLLAPLPSDADERAEENYGPAKVSCENLVTDAVGDKAFVVRAGLIVGPGDRSDRYTYWVERLTRGGTVAAPGSPDDLVQVVDVRDLARWLLDGAEQRIVGVFDGVGPTLSRGQLLADTATGVGITPTFTWLDQELLRTHDVNPWSGPRSLPLWLPRPDYVGMLAHDPEPARAAGLVTRPIAETARDTLHWLRESGHRTSRAGLTPDEEAELLASAG